MSSINKFQINGKDVVINGTIFDISEHTSMTFSNLESALGNNGSNIPENMRKGGMTVKFIQSSDNKYVQYRLMTTSFNTTPANWQGVDDEPTKGSNNLVKSGGVNLLKKEHFITNGDDIKYIKKLNTYVDSRSGLIVGHPTWKTYLIDLDFVEITNLHLVSAKSHTFVCILSYFDKKGNFISGSIAEQKTYTIENIVVPTNAAYIGISWDSFVDTISVEGNFNVSRFKNTNFYKSFDDFYKGNVSYNGNNDSVYVYKFNGYVNVDGVLTNHESWKTHIFDLNYHTLSSLELTLNQNQDTVNAICGFDVKGSMIFGIKSEIGVYGLEDFSIPSNCCYLAFCTDNYTSHDTISVESTVNLNKFKKIKEDLPFCTLYVANGNEADFITIENKYVNGDGGYYYHNDWKTYTIDLEIIDLKSFSFRSTYAQNTSVISYWDKNLHFLEANKQLKEAKTYTLQDVSIPNNCRYIRICWDSLKDKFYYLEYKLKLKQYIDISTEYFSISNGKTSKYVNKIDRYVDNNGNFQGHPTWKSYLIDLDFVEITNFSLISKSENSVACNLSYFDVNKKFISGVTATIKTYTLQDIDIPNKCKYLCISWDNVDTMSLVEGVFNVSKFKTEVNSDDYYNKEIVYVGDSITSGTYGNYASESYNMLKSECPGLLYKNYGIHSGTSVNISAVNGGITITITEDVVIPASKDLGVQLTLSNNIHNHFGDVIGNPYSVGGILGNFTWEGGQSGDFSNKNYRFNRLEDGIEKSFKSGTIIIVSDAAKHNLNAYIQSIFIGTNDDLNTQSSCNSVIQETKNLANLSKNKHFIVISPYKDNLSVTNFLEPLKQEFGNKLIDLYTYFREYGVRDGIDLGLFTQEETEDHTWQQLLLDGGRDSSNYGIHPSREGYHLIALLVYDRIKLLGYIQ